MLWGFNTDFDPPGMTCNINAPPTGTLKQLRSCIFLIHLKLCCRMNQPTFNTLYVLGYMHIQFKSKVIKVRDLDLAIMPEQRQDRTCSGTDCQTLDSVPHAEQ